MILFSKEQVGRQHTLRMLYASSSETKICVSVDVSGAETKIRSQDERTNITALCRDHEELYFMNVNGTFIWTT